MKTIILVVTLLTIALASQARELYPGQYAQVDPEIRHWFQQQTVPPSPKNPSSGALCCSEADGEAVEEQIRDGRYWVKAGGPAYEGTKSTIENNVGRGVAPPDGMDADGWVPVPDEVIIHGPNKFGRPVVWWYRGVNPDGSWKITIRCYAPGPLM